MLRYETLFVTVPEITSDEAGRLEKTLGKAVADSKGAVISFDRWGKYHLAYPIRKYDYGVYYLMRFEVDDARKNEVLESLKKLYGVGLNDLIMRNVLVRMHPEGSLEYQRPDSLEEAPKDIDNIMKESKSILRRGRGSRDESRRDDAPRREVAQKAAPQESSPQAPTQEPAKETETVEVKETVTVETESPKE